MTFCFSLFFTAKVRSGCRFRNIKSSLDETIRISNSIDIEKTRYTQLSRNKNENRNLCADLISRRANHRFENVVSEFYEFPHSKDIISIFKFRLNIKSFEDSPRRSRYFNIRSRVFISYETSINSLVRLALKTHQIRSFPSEIFSKI